MKKMIVFSEKYFPSANTLAPILYRILNNIKVDEYVVLSQRKKNEKIFPSWLYENQKKSKIDSIYLYEKKIENIIFNEIFKIITQFFNTLLFLKKIIKYMKVDVDIIFSSTMPAGYHKYGFLFKVLNPRAKWIAFFSDPYSNSPFENFDYKIEKNNFYYLRVLKKKILKFNWHLKKKIFLLEEKLVYKYASKIIYVSEAQREFCYKGNKKEIQTLIIPFYYLSEWKKKILFKIQNECGRKNLKYNKKKINLVHPGNIYGNRKPDNFFRALKKFETKLHYYNCGVFKIDLIEEFGLNKIVTSLGEVDYEVLLQNISESDYVVVIDSFFDKIKNPYMPSKVVDAMYFGKPIIAITDLDTELDKFCRITGNISIRNDVEDIESELKKILDPKFYIKPDYSMFCDLTFDIL